MDRGQSHHLLPEKIKPLQTPHRLCSHLYISEGHVRLSAHLVVSYRVDVEDGAVGREEGVEGEAEVGLGELFGEIGNVKSVRGLAVNSEGVRLGGE